ncbi:MAG TPA: hypothetical protein VJN65_09090, partial [Bacteroidota bacterium]|nr:hypothetical protein [Bacteroidota bacterium]
MKRANEPTSQRTNEGTLRGNSGVMERPVRALLARHAACPPSFLAGSPAGCLAGVAGYSDWV